MASDGGKEHCTDGGVDLSGGPDGSAITPCCHEEVETETTHSDSGRQSGAIWSCPGCGNEWKHPTETVLRDGPWSEYA